MAELGKYEKYLNALQARDAGKWGIGRLLGTGNSAAVFHVTREGKAYALKIYDSRFFQERNGAIERRRITDQVKLRDHGCASLIDIVDVGDIEDTSFVLMEYLGWPTLESIVPKMPFENIASLIRQLASAAKYLEERGYVHRDIKPANILVAPDLSSVKLIDLGVMRSLLDSGSELTDHGSARPFVATAQYSSPEYLFRLLEPSERTWRGLTFYQLGAVLHDLIMRRPLFDEAVRTQNRYVLAMAVYRDIPKIQSTDVPNYLVWLARKCLEKDLDRRLQHVTWQSFLMPNAFDETETRARLKLTNANASGIVQQGLSKQQKKVLLNKASETLQELVHTILRSEQYPPAEYKSFPEEDSSRRFYFRFRPANADADWQRFQINFEIQASGDNQLDISVSAYLTDKDTVTAPLAAHSVWTTTFNELQSDASGALKQVVSQLVLRLYGEADYRLSALAQGATEEVWKEEVNG